MDELGRKIQHLIRKKYTLSEIGHVLGIPYHSLRHQMRKRNIIVKQKYNNISERRLARIVSEMLEENWRLGEKFINGRLRQMDIYVRRSTLRETIKAVAGTRPRPGRLRRREYYVRAPLSLVHLDGNHKLIRWRIVIHGAIDGYSRLIFCMGASDNNRATTVLKLFLKGVRRWGLPSRVRVDRGGENEDVARFMIATRGEGRGSMLFGRSVHNQRIERLWRDAWNAFTSVFYETFRGFERQGILNPDSEMDVYCLHIVYLPLINEFIAEFVNTWNNHDIRTVAGHPTPDKLFELGTFILKKVSEETGKRFTELNQDVPLQFDTLQRTEQIPDFEDPVYVPPIVVPFDRHHHRALKALFSGRSIRLERARHCYLVMREYVAQYWEQDE